MYFNFSWQPACLHTALTWVRGSCWLHQGLALLALWGPRVQLQSRCPASPLLFCACVGCSPSLGRASSSAPCPSGSPQLCGRKKCLFHIFLKVFYFCFPLPYQVRVASWSSLRRCWCVVVSVAACACTTLLCRWPCWGWCPSGSWVSLSGSAELPRSLDWLVFHQPLQVGKKQIFFLCYL